MILVNPGCFSSFGMSWQAFSVGIIPTIETIGAAVNAEFVRCFASIYNRESRLVLQAWILGPEELTRNEG